MLVPATRRRAWTASHNGWSMVRKSGRSTVTAGCRRTRPIGAPVRRTAPHTTWPMYRGRRIFDRYNIVSETDLRDAAKRLNGVAGRMAENVTENVTAPTLLSPTRPNSGLDAAGGRVA